MSRRWTLFGRALRLRCPNCGGKHVVRRWLVIADDCPTCGISLVRGNRVGAYVLNLGVAEALTAGLIIAVTVATWPTPPWDLLGWLAPILAVTSPLIFYPFSRLAFVAIDLAMHPNTVRDEDVTDDG